MENYTGYVAHVKEFLKIMSVANWQLFALIFLILCRIKIFFLPG